jgi:hypothetical protein
LRASIRPGAIQTVPALGLDHPGKASAELRSIIAPGCVREQAMAVWAWCGYRAGVGAD